MKKSILVIVLAWTMSGMSAWGADLEKPRAEIIEPAGATFEIASTKPPKDIENSNKGTSMLAVNIKRQGNLKITIVLQPDIEKMAVAPIKNNLANWK